MGATSKSPQKVLLTGYLIGKLALPDYSHKCSPKTYTQPQLFACLVKLADVYDNFCDARDAKERAKFAEKAERAIQCTGDATELQQAVGMVRRLVAGSRRSM